MPKISELPDATTVNDVDEIVILQGGVVKRATKTELGATGAASPISNTDGQTGTTIYVGSVTPSSPVAGDVWIKPV